MVVQSTHGWDRLKGTTGVIKACKSKNDKQYNDQAKHRKIKTDWATQTPQVCSGSESSYSTRGTVSSGSYPYSRSCQALMHN